MNSLKDFIVLTFAFTALLKSIIFAQGSLHVRIEELKINSDHGFSNQSNPIISNYSDAILISWRDYRNGEQEIFVSNKFLRSGNSQCNNMISGIDNQKFAVDRNNDIFNCFLSDNKLYIKKYDTDFNEIKTSEIDITNFTSITQYFNISVNKSDELAVVLVGKKGFQISNGLYGIRLSVDLIPLDDFKLLIPLPVDSEIGLPQIKALDNHKFVTAIKSNKNVLLQIFDNEPVFDQLHLVNENNNDILVGSNPVIAVNIANTFGIGFLSNNFDNTMEHSEKIYFQKYTLSGEKINNNLIVSSSLSDGFNRYYPAIASINDGSYLLSWWERDTSGRKLLYQIVEDDNNLLFSQDQVICSSQAMQIYVAVSTTSSDSILFLYEKLFDNTSQIVQRKLNYNDNTLSNESFLCRNSGSVSQDFPVVSNSYNNILSIWSYNKRLFGVSPLFYRKVDQSGELSSEIVISLDDTVTTNIIEDIHKLDDENYFFPWIKSFSSERSDVNGKLINCFGETIKDIFINEIDNYLITNITSSLNGLHNSIIVWKQFENEKLLYQKLNSDFTKIGENTILDIDLTGYNIGFPEVLLNDNNDIFLFWREEARERDYLFMQRYDFDFVKIDSQKAVVKSSTPGIDIKDLDAEINLKSGNMVVAWIDNRNGDDDLFAQMYDNNGSKIGTNILINDDNAGSRQSSPRVSIQEDDKFVITWSDDRSGSPDIYAQLFNSDGSKWEINFLVNSHTGRNQINPDVNLENDFISFSWSSNHLEGTGYDIFVKQIEWDFVDQIVDETSENLGSSFFINPNPFNSETTLTYVISEAAFVTIELFDVLGRQIKQLQSEYKSAGLHTLRLSAKNLSSGIYYCRISADKFYDTKKILLLK